MTRLILHIASQAAHTTLKIYKPMEISTDAQTRDRTRNLLLTIIAPQPFGHSSWCYDNGRFLPFEEESLILINFVMYMSLDLF